MPGPKEVRGHTGSYTASAALSKYRLVALNGSGELAYAGVGDEVLGRLEAATFAQGDQVSVLHKNAEGTVILIADGAIVANAPIFGTANGKVNDTNPGGATRIGIALAAAAADLDQVECLLD